MFNKNKIILSITLAVLLLSGTKQTKAESETKQIKAGIFSKIWSQCKVWDKVDKINKINELNSSTQNNFDELNCRIKETLKNHVFIKFQPKKRIQKINEKEEKTKELDKIMKKLTAKKKHYEKLIILNNEIIKQSTQIQSDNEKIKSLESKLLSIKNEIEKLKIQNHDEPFYNENTNIDGSQIITILNEKYNLKKELEKLKKSNNKLLNEFALNKRTYSEQFKKYKQSKITRTNNNEIKNKIEIKINSLQQNLIELNRIIHNLEYNNPTKTITALFNEYITKYFPQYPCLKINGIPFYHRVTKRSCTAFTGLIGTKIALNYKSSIKTKAIIIATSVVAGLGLNYFINKPAKAKKYQSFKSFSKNKISKLKKEINYLKNKSWFVKLLFGTKQTINFKEKKIYYIKSLIELLKKNKNYLL